MSDMSKKWPVDSMHAVAKSVSRKAKTAREIAEEIGRSKPAVYALIETMKKAGYKFATSMVRYGATGPEAKAYKLSKRGSP